MLSGKPNFILYGSYQSFHFNHFNSLITNWHKTNFLFVYISLSLCLPIYILTTHAPTSPSTTPPTTNHQQQLQRHQQQHQLKNLNNNERNIKSQKSNLLVFFLLEYALYFDQFGLHFGRNVVRDGWRPLCVVVAYIWVRRATIVSR